MKSLGNIGKFFGRGKQVAPSVIGFRHASGVGIRSKTYVFPISRGASGFARSVANDADMTFIENRTRAQDLAGVEFLGQNFLQSLAAHPHTAGIFLIAFGDESVSIQELAGSIQALGTPCEYLIIDQCSTMEIAYSVAQGTAQEIKSMALSGLEQVESATLAITYRDEPENLQSLVALLEENNYHLHTQQVSDPRSVYLPGAAMAGVHAILSFVEPEDYPSGTLNTPVINLASGSSLHQRLEGSFDLGYPHTHSEILEKIRLTFGMVPTVSESTGLFEPIFADNIPSLDDLDGHDEICLIPANPVLIPFLIDLVSHQSGFFLKDLESFAGGSIDAKKILVVGISDRDFQSLGALSSDPRFVRSTLAENSSLANLAGAILNQR